MKIKPTTDGLHVHEQSGSGSAPELFPQQLLIGVINYQVRAELPITISCQNPGMFVGDDLSKQKHGVGVDVVVDILADDYQGGQPGPDLQHNNRA